MSIVRFIWRKIGNIAYFALLPLIRVYADNTKPRARVLLVHEGHILVVKNWLGGGGWALPGGGLEKNESAPQAGARELKEELGIQVDIETLQDLGEHTSIERRKLKAKHYLLATELPSRLELTVRKREIVETAWLSFSDIQQMDKGMSNTVKEALGVWIEHANLV